MQGKSRAVTPLGAGIVGTALGVALGATSVALSNKQNRKKFLKAVTDVKQKTTKKVGELKKLDALRAKGKANGKAHGNGHMLRKAKKVMKGKTS